MGERLLCKQGVVGSIPIASMFRRQAAGPRVLGWVFWVGCSGLGVLGWVFWVCWAGLDSGLLSGVFGAPDG